MSASDLLPPAEALRALAEAHGVTHGYHDGTGTWREAPVEALVAVLRELGAPLRSIDDAPDALREGRERAPAAPPVVTIACGVAMHVDVPAVHPRSGPPPQAALHLESGQVREVPVSAENSGAGPVWRVHPGSIDDVGVHRLDVGDASIHVLVPPARLPAAPRGCALFAPLYGLRSGLHGDGRDGFATYADLARLGAWASTATRRAVASEQGRGAVWIGTLPVLAGFLDEPFEPSPYSPVSRAFWSELYADPALDSGLGGLDDDEVRRLLRSAAGNAFLSGDARGANGSAGTVETPRETTGIGSGRARIDYRGAMKARRRVVEARRRAVDAAGGVARERFERAFRSDDELVRYAAFRAAVDRRGAAWDAWDAAGTQNAPGRTRPGGDLRAGLDYDEAVARDHAFAQILARRQLGAAATAGTAGLYLDFPLGCHRGGYDTWRHPDDFALGIDTGAPPDGVFAGGQNWAFPPLHPEGARRSGYAALRAALAHHFSCATLLRIDHVMGLHRLFWIPRGMGPAEGLYVRSHHEELWALVAIEAARRGAAVVGEDLGTVPDAVRHEMHARGALRMHVVPFEQRGDHEETPLVEPPASSLACLGTHDMEPFAAWWEGLGPRREFLNAWLRSKGLLADVEGTRQDDAPAPDRNEDAAEAAASASTRRDKAQAAAALGALLEWLSRSDATVVLASLEDLWLERERQNQPGTTAEYGNWQRPFARAFEEFERDPAVLSLLARLRGDRSVDDAATGSADTASPAPSGADGQALDIGVDRSEGLRP